MHTLTDNKYLPELTPGYSFALRARDDGYDGVIMAILRRRPLSEKKFVYEHHISIEPHKVLDKEHLKAVILANARRVAGQAREWNPEFSRNLSEIMKELKPPKDDTPEDKGEYFGSEY